jgi:CO/xanthine dehydrogenase FAD-binding subunit
MKPVYLPRHMDELWQCLSDHPEAGLYAGGTDVLVRLRKRLVNPPSLICLERIEALKGIRDQGESVFVGSGTTCSQILADPLMHRAFPVLVKALGSLGSPQIRNMATIGGNVITASPAGDSLPALYVLRAKLELRTGDRSLLVPVRDFIKGPGQTDLRPGEILSGVRLPKPNGFQHHHFEKVGQRKALAIAIASFAALLRISDTGLVEEARFAWGSVGPTVVTSKAVESSLVGRPLNAGTLKEAAVLAGEAVSPIDDVRATASYRRLVAGNLLLRLLGYLPQAHGKTLPGES